MPLTFIAMNPASDASISRVTSSQGGSNVANVESELRNAFNRVISVVMVETQEGLVELDKDDILEDGNTYYVEFGMDLTKESAPAPAKKCLKESVKDRQAAAFAPLTTNCDHVRCSIPDVSTAGKPAIKSLFDSVGQQDFKSLYQQILACRGPFQCCGTELCEKIRPSLRSAPAVFGCPAPRCIC